ncbi:MAG TPA: diguanylate cyclase [Nitrospiria bacterium]|nr:diguanylate cyclase [Nitrospiria bacterium]
MRGLDQVLKYRPAAVVFIGLLLVVLLGIVDYLSGPEISFSIFYLFPIYLVSWYAGRWPGVVVSLASGLAWYLADRLDGHVYSSPPIPYWNASVRVGFFLITVYLLSELRRRLIVEAELAHTDPLTRIANRRGVYRAVEAELVRQRRTGRPFTAAYLDVDGFKAVNDRLGHHAGDELLRVVAETIRSQVRQLDTAGRLGGDEFLILLPETDGEAAHELLIRLSHSLTHEMRLRGWPVTFSIGASTFLDPPDSIDALLRQSDRLLYAAKTDGKDTIRRAIIGEDRANPTTRPSGAASRLS